MIGKKDLTSKAVAARIHITNIRNTKFSIGSKVQNPLTRDLHNAVTRLSSELYAKDIHFLMELIQNAEDNNYASTVEPTLEFVFIKEDITGIGAPATLLVFNNEVGFSQENIDSLCSIGQSTKKAKRCQGFIGEKGIGFKSVFIVSAHPYIFSNGYQIRFCEVPNGDCEIGYIVPEWVTERPSKANLERIYGNRVLPTTTIILPLKTEKVEAVKNELRQIHPEVLLFLQKIKRLTVRDEHAGLSCKGFVSAVSIVNETILVPSSNEFVDSRVVKLSAQQGSKENSLDTCRYFLHKQVFHINTSIIVEERKGLKELMICLAFPFGKRLKRGASASGIFAFLPTGMVTNLPFIIHSDFVLASSRETILMDNRWNLGSLILVPSVYVRALVACLNFVEAIGLGTKSHVLDFLPTKESPFPELNSVRYSIKLMLQSECIVPCESISDEKIVLRRPSDALVICPKFRSILAKAKLHRIALGVVSSQTKLAIHDSVDHEKYAETWKFLGVNSASCSYGWYLNFFKASNLISLASEDMYIDIICFLADNWASFSDTSINNIPIFKYVIRSGYIKLGSVLQIRQETFKIRIVWEADEHAWLSKWNREIGCPNDVFFCPDYLVNSLVKGENQENLKKWFISTMGVVFTNIFTYCMELVSFIRENKNKDPRIVVSLTHFVYFSTMKNYIKYHDIQRLLRFLPVVEKSGKVSLCSRSLVPATTGTWTRLFGLINPLSVESASRLHHDYFHHNGNMDDSRQKCGYYAELGDVYSAAVEFNGETIAENDLLNFLVKNEKAVDLPYASPPDVALKLASNELTCDQALLLLKWVRNLRHSKQPELLARFFESIRSTKWLKTHIGFRCPKNCYVLGSVENKAILELGRKLEVFSAIDEVYYSHKTRSYIDELKFIGVQVRTETMSELIIPHVSSLASSELDPALVILLLEFIKNLREIYRLNRDLKKNLQEGKWLKTVNGYACPFGSVLLASSEQAVEQITNLQVVDTLYYGEKIHCFLDELKFLGVVVDVGEVYKLISKNVRFPENLSSLTLECMFLLLECIRSVGPESICANHDIRCKAWIKTSHGFTCPSETILYNSDLIDLADVLSFSFIDESYYGIKIKSYKAELAAIGVTVGLESAEELVVNRLKSDISSFGLSAVKVISLLRLFYTLKILKPSFVGNVVSFVLSGERWVKTKHGYQYAVDSILFDSEWADISQLVDLPFIDETFYGAEICSLKDVLKMLGVVVNLRDGLHFVVHGLEVQEDPSLVTADGAFSILQCAESLVNSSVPSDKLLLEELLQKLSVAKWMKTHMGYRLPSESLLFKMEWECHLMEIDGPFLDRTFYKKFTSEHDNVLIVIGVKIDMEDACSWIFKNIRSHVRTDQIKRIYKFLKKFHWTPKPEDSSRHELWIPNQLDNSRGKWVNNVDCVIHDEDNLFGHCLYSLDDYYEEGLLTFLRSAFHVPEIPSLDHYAGLWKFWCETAEFVSVEKLKLFWRLLLMNWARDVLRNQENIQSSFTRLPAVDASWGNIQLLDKEEVYIGDELLLKKAFTESSKDPLFAWFPEDNSVSSVLLYEMYRSLGVKNISESVEYSVYGHFEKLEKEVDLIGKPLVKLVMAFLASSQMSIPKNERHSRVKALSVIPTFGTVEPLQVRYSLQLPVSKKCLYAHIHKKVFFDGSAPRFLIHKPSWFHRKKDIQLINDFARAISDAVLPDLSLSTQDLFKLLKMGFAFLLTEQDIDEQDIDELLMSENLEVSVEDQEFLDELFSPEVITSLSPLHFTSTVSTGKPNLGRFKRSRYN